MRVLPTFACAELVRRFVRVCVCACVRVCVCVFESGAEARSRATTSVKLVSNVDGLLFYIFSLLATHLLLRFPHRCLPAVQLFNIFWTAKRQALRGKTLK